MDNITTATKTEDVEFGIGVAEDGTAFVVLRVAGEAVAFPASWMPAVLDGLMDILEATFSVPEGEALN